MIIISKKADYAILLLHRLGRSNEGVSARALADEYGLSRPFIANILKGLCQQNLVESQRGAHGGYKLARRPSEITLAEVITAMDGPVQLMSCVGEELVDPSCKLSQICPVRSPLQLVHQRVMEALSGVTVAELDREAPVLIPIEPGAIGHVGATPLPR